MLYGKAGMSYHTGMYPHVFVAGTFDKLHKGHEAFLTQAFTVGDRVTIGLTSDGFIGKFKSNDRSYASFSDRKKKILSWMDARDFGNRGTVIPIDDPFEPAASMDDIDAILVTRDNFSRGEEINKKRAAKHMREVILVDVPIVDAQDKAPISSTRIANNIIDTEGRLIMPDAMRPELAKPLGKVLTGDAIGSSIEKNRSGIIITVGDMTTKTFLTAGVIPNLTVVDFLVGRKPFPDLDNKLTELNLYRVRMKSGPGYIAEDVIDFIKKWSTHPEDKTVLAIGGEEDLLALPSIAYGPAGSVVYYGQPHEGLVEVYADEKRTDAAGLLTRFASD